MKVLKKKKIMNSRSESTIVTGSDLDSSNYVKLGNYLLDLF